MKKAKILSLLLAAVMLLSLIPAVGLTAVANTSATEPTILPNGDVIDSKLAWVDWSAAADGSSGKVDKTASTYELTAATSSDYYHAGDFYGSATTAWQGASGIMFYVDKGTNETVDFSFRLQTSGTRKTNNSDTNAGSANLVSSAVVWQSPLKENAVSPSYWYDETNAEWKKCGTYHPNNAWLDYTTSDFGSGWYYIPFTSFYYGGVNGKQEPTKDDVALGKCDFNDFMGRFADSRLAGLFLLSTSVGAKFGNIHFVYPQLEDNSSRSSATYFHKAGVVGVANWTVGGTGTYTADNSTRVKKVTVTGMAGNTASSIANTVLLADAGATTGMTGATGIRFTVDTTALGEARLQLRIRFYSNKACNEIANKPGMDHNNPAEVIYGTGNAGYKGSGNTGKMLYMALFNNSVAYYYDENGVAKPLHITTPGSETGDLFEALPAGYQGDIYIPMESFGVRFETMNCILPATFINDYTTVSGIQFSHAYQGTPENDEVVYSGFQILYANDAINSANVTVSDTLNLNFHMNTDTATGVTTTYSFGEDNGNATFTEGKFSYEILPQQMAEKVTVKYTATVGDAATQTHSVEQTVSISVAEYLNKLLQGAPSGNLQKLIADMLNYGAAAQKIAGGAAITTIGGGTTVTERTATVAKNLTTSTDAGKSFTSATIRLESAVALRLNLNLDTTENVTVKVTLNGREQTFTGDELAAKTILYTDIKATEYDDEITATISVGDDVKQTLTYSVNTYLAALDTANADYDALADAVWAYGQSASAYAAAPDAGN